MHYQVYPGLAMLIALTLKHTLLLALAAMMVTTTAAQQSNGSTPFDNLPDNIDRLTYFGERPSFSPDGSKIAFMSKSYGDAFQFDLETEQITLLTHYPHAGYLRVQYLPNGDLFLIGPRNFNFDDDLGTLRDSEMEMWVLKNGSNKAVALNHKIWEGVAISRHRNLISWANTDHNYPDQISTNVSIMYTAEIVYLNGGEPALANQREVLRTTWPECRLEPQDFLKNDTELTYSCYDLPSGLDYGLSYVNGINLETGVITTYRKVDYEYNEVEGIYPNGKFTLVESTREQLGPSRIIDLWRLRLEPNSTDFTRLTFFGKYPPYKAGNPVISPDGCSMAFQTSKVGDEAGIGYGINLMKFEGECGCSN